MKRKIAPILLSLGLLFVSPGAEAADMGMHIDQVGYLPDRAKTAMVTDSGESTFSLVDAQTGETVYMGTLGAPVFAPLAEETLRRADFSDFTRSGRYVLRVGARTSYDFVIDENVYALPMVHTWRSYTLSRSNTKMEDAVTGLSIRSGHAQDRRAEVYFTDAVSKKGERRDVAGGWYDAGDYGKYVTTAAISTAQLMLAYEDNSAHFTRGQLLFPEGIQTDGTLPDALAEVRFELDWMRTMERRDGSMFHKVAGLSWPGFDKSPDTDTQERYIFGSCTSSAAMCGAAYALGARVYAAHDPVYAADLGARAERIWKYLERHPQPLYRRDEGQESGSGPYDKETDFEERLWLAAELFRTTGDRQYERYLLSNAVRFTEKPSFYTWNDTLALAQFAYARAAGADADLQGRVRAAFLSYADDICESIAQDGFFCALSRDEYTWASTKNSLSKGNILLMANTIMPRRVYEDGALDQIHYLFGRNALDKSFLTGIGDNPPAHPHNRIRESTGVYVPGLVIGGPNAVPGGDPDQTAYLESAPIPVAKSYLDVLTSWSTNEYAIDYTAAAAYALAHFAAPVTPDAETLRAAYIVPSKE